MSDAFDVADAPTARAEGGYVNDPRDPGGETNHGITVGVARQAGYRGAMREMTAAQAKAIRKALYWTPLNLDAVAALSPAVAAEVYDTAINMGSGVAGRFLQRALNVLNRGASDFADLAVDGAPGKATVASLKAYLLKRGKAGEAVLLRALNCLQGARYIEIAEGRAASEAFVFGWLANRVGLA